MHTATRLVLALLLALAIAALAVTACGDDDDDDNDDDTGTSDDDDDDDDNGDDDDDDSGDDDDDTGDDDASDDDDDTTTRDHGVQFDGSSGYGVTGSNLAPAVSTATATLEGWLYLKENPPADPGYVLSYGQGNAGYVIDYFEYGGKGTLAFTYIYLNGKGTGRWIGSTSTLPVNQWFHFAATYQDNGTGATVCLYVDGNQEKCSIYPEKVLAASAPLYVGWSSYAGGFLYGGVDELRISNTVRYAGSFTAPAAPFEADADTVALIHFDEGTGSIAADATANGNNLDLSGSYTWELIP